MNFYKIISGVSFFIIGFYYANITTAVDEWPGVVISLGPLLLCWIFGIILVLSGMERYSRRDVKYFTFGLFVFILGSALIVLVALTKPVIMGISLGAIIILIGLIIMIYGIYIMTGVLVKTTKDFIIDE